MRNHLDAYFTPPELTHALIARLKKRTMWRDEVMVSAGGTRKRVVAEPCAGDGWISNVLRSSGYQVVTGDIDPARPVHYPGTDIFSRDAEKFYQDADIIITNPPYTDVALYVRRALEIVPQVAMLLRVTFLEPIDSQNPGSSRADLLADLDSVIVLPRTSFIHGKRGTDSATCAWFLWGRAVGFTPKLEFVTNSELATYTGQQDLFLKEES